MNQKANVSKGGNKQKQNPSDLYIKLKKESTNRNRPRAMRVNLRKLSYCFPKWIYHKSKTEIQKRTSWSSLYNLKKKKKTRLLRRP